MPKLNMYDPTQKPSLHADVDTFDDPIRKVGPDVTQTFDQSESNPTEWAGSEALENATERGRQADARNPEAKVRADAIDTGIDDADLTGILNDEDEEDEADEEDLDLDDEDVDETDERLIDENGFKKIR